MKKWEDLPKEIQDKMLEHQLTQNGKTDPNVFIRDSTAILVHGGIDWEDTPEGFEYWYAVIYGDNHDVFHREYPKTKNGIQLIAEERRRQIDVEGYTIENDNHFYTNDELAYVAACYAIPHNARNIYAGQNGLSNIITVLWPWDKQFWKPTPENRIKELTKAGALIAAEIDRLQLVTNE